MIFLEVTCEFINFFLCKSGSLRVKGTVDAVRGVPDEALPAESPGRRRRLATQQARARDSVFPSVKWAGWTRQTAWTHDPETGSATRGTCSSL